jgi:FlaA1/EpsC-like NDP-sugar epimerase
MSLTEAVDAILASGMAELEGKILVPELGTPTRITDLAKLLIGEVGIPIVFTGCRPGDKLTEELVSKTETVEGAVGPLQVIRTCRVHPPEVDQIMKQLCDCIHSNDVHRLIRLLCTVVPEYVPSDLLR